MNLLERYNQVRRQSVDICRPLKTEDYVVQPIGDVSPPKWHLGHITWFFETFILKPYSPSYVTFNRDYDFVFNSYYETVGARVIRTDRGNLSRPAVEDILLYRNHVDNAMRILLTTHLTAEIETLVILGCNHEEQHQELLFTDIKYILGHNPLFPAYGDPLFKSTAAAGSPSDQRMISVPEGVYEIGYRGTEFCFDNELTRHKVFLEAYQVNKIPVTNAEYMEFMEAGGYHDFKFWHAEGWDWVNRNKIESPLYWYRIDGEWKNYSWHGLESIDPSEPVCHISYYEAAAYAAWRGKRLPTEMEWEAASRELSWGKRWEWTESAYLPYPGFIKAPGAIGEYNGKFMISQMVLRGASEVTPPDHSRPSYRNFFHPSSRWQYTGIRLAW